MNELNKLLKALNVCGYDLDKEVLETVLNARNRVSPWVIEDLEENEVFVFGSDERGIHDGRASLNAVDEFGALQGLGEGWDLSTRRSYAIPTTKVNPKYKEEAEEFLGKLMKADTKEKRECVLKEHSDFCKDKKGDNAFKISRDLESELKPSVETFIKVAAENTDKKFMVTRIGGGFAGFSDEDVAPLFKDALKLKNVYLPKSFLDELFDESLSEGCPSNMVPSTCEGNEDFPAALERQLALYSRWVRKNLFDVSKKIECLEVIDRMERMCSCVMKAVDMYYRGLPANAYDCIKGRLDSLLNDGGVYCSFSELKDEVFYRMRVENDNWVKKNVDKNGMFHIPFSLRGIVKTQRYSVPGFPCLYLGKHVEGCWEELGRPTMSNCLISRFQQKDGAIMKVLDMRMPNVEDWYADKEKTRFKHLLEIKSMVAFFPLIIACTFRTKHQNDAFKPEYIVPQLVLQYVKEYGYKQNRVKAKEDREIYGVMYTSVQMKKPQTDVLKKPQTDVLKEGIYTNVVLPVIDIKESHCSRLMDLFEWTEPYCVEFAAASNHGALEDGGSRFAEIEHKLCQIDLHDQPTS